MGTLSTELAPHAERLSPRPRIYADANVPAGIVAYMRLRLHWDVLFVLEDDELRRARDVKHYQLAQQLRRTLVTMDRDYLDDRRFPPDESGGVLVIRRPTSGSFRAARRVDRMIFQRRRPDDPVPLPLAAASCRSTPTGAANEHACPVPSSLVADRAPGRDDCPVGRPRCCPTACSRPARSSSTTAASPKSDPTRRRPATPRRRSPSTAITSCRASSTCTCTASRASTRSIAGDGDRVDRGATAALRRHRLLPDDCRVRAGCATAVLDRSARARATPLPRAARVLPAHLESNFINPEYAARSRSHACARRERRSSRSGRAGQAAGGCRQGGDASLRARRFSLEIERARAGRRHRHARAGAGWRPGSDSLARGARASRVARSFRRDLRRGDSRRLRRARGMRRICSTACRRSATARRAWPVLCCRPRDRRGTHLRRRPRAPRDRPCGSCRQTAVARHGHHRRHRGRRPAAPGRARRSAASRLPPASRPRCSPTARSPAASLTMDRAFRMLVGASDVAGRRGDAVCDHCGPRARAGRPRCPGTRRDGRSGHSRRQSGRGADLRCRQLVYARNTAVPAPV